MSGFSTNMHHGLAKTQENLSPVTCLGLELWIRCKKHRENPSGAGWERETLTLLSLVKEIRVVWRARWEISALFPWENIKSALSFAKNGFSV